MKPLKDIDPHYECCRAVINQIANFLDRCIIPGASFLAEAIRRGEFEVNK